MNKLSRINNINSRLEGSKDEITRRCLEFISEFTHDELLAVVNCDIEATKAFHDKYKRLDGDKIFDDFFSTLSSDEREIFNHIKEETDRCILIEAVSTWRESNSFPKVFIESQFSNSTKGD